MPRSINRCPSCREPVSPFAAGCAICGADLERARADLSARRAARPSVRLPALPAGRPGVDFDWLQTVIAVLLSLFVSPVGLILSLYWARQHQHVSNTLMMWVMLGAAALAVAVFLIPGWYWSSLDGGI